MVLLADKTSIATGHWWLKKMANTSCSEIPACRFDVSGRLDPAALYLFLRLLAMPKNDTQVSSPVMTSVIHLGLSGRKRLSRLCATFTRGRVCSLVSLYPFCGQLSKVKRLVKNSLNCSKRKRKPCIYFSCTSHVELPAELGHSSSTSLV